MARKSELEQLIDTLLQTAWWVSVIVAGLAWVNTETSPFKIPIP